MILAEIKTYLVAHRRADLTDLSARFEIEREALRGMLDVWVARGRVRRLGTGSMTCKTCCGCEAAGSDVYEWISD